MAITQYIKRFVESGRDGTICAYLYSGELGTMTIENHSIVSASLGGLAGRTAFDAIRRSAIKDAAFWTDVTQKNDVQRMLRSLRKPSIPKAPAQTQTQTPMADEIEGDTQFTSAELRFSDVNPAMKINYISDQNIKKITKTLNRFVGPAAGIMVDEALAEAQCTNELILTLSRELIEEVDVDNFLQSAYFALSAAE